MRADKHYYVNADRSRIVDENDPDVAYLLAAQGDDISDADARKYQLGEYAPKKPEPKPAAKAEEKPAEAKAVEKAPANKARQMPAQDGGKK